MTLLFEIYDRCGGSGREKGGAMAGVIGEAGQVGQGPADGDGEPDADLADRPGQQIRQQDAHAERDDREDDAHARALDGAIEPVEQKQAADAGIKRPLNAQVQNACREHLRLPRLHKAAHKRLGKCEHERRNDDRKRRAGNGRLPEALFEARFLSCAVVLRHEGGKGVAEVLHGQIGKRVDLDGSGKTLVSYVDGNKYVYLATRSSDGKISLVK